MWSIADCPNGTCYRHWTCLKRGLQINASCVGRVVQSNELHIQLVWFPTDPESFHVPNHQPIIVAVCVCVTVCWLRCVWHAFGALAAVKWAASWLPHWIAGVCWNDSRWAILDEPILDYLPASRMSWCSFGSLSARLRMPFSHRRSSC